MHPPSPNLVFRVGVSGHCPDQLPKDYLSKYDSTLDEILKAIVTAIEEAARKQTGIYSEQPAAFRILSCLAEGADHVVAESALRNGFELQAVLPFDPEDYELDFASAEAAPKFRNLLKHPKCTARLEIDGNRSSLRDESYEAAGRIVLQQSDLLIVIWNGQKPRGQGGTGQIVQEALEGSTPVIWIPADNPSAWNILLATEDIHRVQSGSAVLSSSERTRILAETIQGIVLPPADQQAAIQSYHRTKTQKLSVYFVWQAFLRLVTKQPFSGVGGEFSRPRFADFEERVKSEWREEAATAPQPTQEFCSQLDSRLLHHFAWADKLAEDFTAAYRAAFLANYLLAAAAVIFALIGSTLGWADENHPHHRISFLFNFVEVGCLVIILANTIAVKSLRWHPRSLDLRLLAEWLRQYRFLLPVAGGRMTAARAEHLREYGSPEESWMHWQLRAIVRESGLLNLKMSGDFLAAYKAWANRSLLVSQSQYHADVQNVMSKANSSLHHIAIALFVASLVVAFFHFFVHSPWLDFFGAVLPAVATACAAIRIQGEFEKVTKTSSSMSRSLAQASDDFMRIPPRPQCLSSLPIGRNIHSATRVMNEEVLGWVTVFQDKPVDLA